MTCDLALPTELIPTALFAPAIEHLDVPCCDGHAHRGPEGCTCWEAEYSPRVTPVDTTSVPAPMPARCGDCAFRRDSPERRGDKHAGASWDDLQRLVETETPFWCHDGLPRLTGWRHPAGIHIPAPRDVGSYRPTIVAGIPYRADGTAGSQCAGWAAAVDRQQARDAEDTPLTPLGALLARRPELRGVGISSALEARWSA